MPRTRATQPAGVAAVIESATYVVAASDSQDPTRADFQADGIADEVEINAAIAALPAAGGVVALLEGTYNTAASITIGRDDVTLRGVGYASCIEPQGDFHAIEVAANHHHILIENLQVDGVNTTAAVYGIYLHGLTGEEITESKVENCWVHGFDGTVLAQGIRLAFCKYCIATRNLLTGNGYGIYLSDGYYLTVHGNHVYSNTRNGIENTHSDSVTIIGNDIFDNANRGISMDTGAHNCMIMGNSIKFNGTDGLALTDNNKTIIIGNSIAYNSQTTINTRYGIFLDACDDTVIIGNTIWDRHMYGINISNAACDRTIVKNNYLLGNVTGCINDAGTNTKLATKTFRFTEPINGTIATASPTGISVTAATHQALTWGQLPQEVQQVVRLKVWAVALAGPFAAGGQMLADFTFNAGGSLEAYNLPANSWAIASLESEEADYAINQVIHWVIENGDVGNELANLLGGDSLELFAIHRVAADPDGETNGVFRVLEIEYV